MKEKKGAKDRLGVVQGDESRREHLLAFWDFYRDCFGEGQESPLPGDEFALRLTRSHGAPELKKLPR